MTTAVSRLRVRFWGLLLGSALSLGLALWAARLYRPPDLLGSPVRSSWLEPDTLCSIAAGAVGLAVAGWPGSPRLGARSLLASLQQILSWFFLTTLLWLAWARYLELLTLLVAPGQALAGVRVFLAWRAFRDENRFRATH